MEGLRWSVRTSMEMSWFIALNVVTCNGASMNCLKCLWEFICSLHLTLIRWSFGLTVHLSRLHSKSLSIGQWRPFFPTNTPTVVTSTNHPMKQQFIRYNQVIFHMNIRTLSSFSYRTAITLCQNIITSIIVNLYPHQRGRGSEIYCRLNVYQINFSLSINCPRRHHHLSKA